MSSETFSIDTSAAAVRSDEPVSQLAYAAATDGNRRASVSPRIMSEDATLPQSKRDKLQATARDTARNFSILGWMIRKHLDYVSQFEFHARTDNEDLDRQIENLVRVWQRPQNAHTAGRHTLAKLIRLAEAHRTADGDIGLLLVSDGTIQPIEADLIRTPPEPDNPDQWSNGCRLNRAGKTIAYGVHRRTQRGKRREFLRTIAARNLFLHGFFDRFDQTRGISPLAAALNPLRDVYDNFEYALAKAKVSQLFALIIKSQSIEPFGTHTNSGTTADPKYSVKFGNAPQKLELDPGDDASVLESNQPSGQFQDFTRYMIDVCLKALDIPYSFFDESHTNFFGSRGAWLHYERSCHSKRADSAELLRRLTVWRLSLWIADGSLVLPAGMTLRDIGFEWIARGMPWWDPAKEIKGDLMAIGAGLDTPQRICRERDRGDFYDNVRQIARAQDFARDLGVELTFDPTATEQNANPLPENQEPEE